jgi:ubiquinone/menaquinone biosynthesis C-methylase UbiE
MHAKPDQPIQVVPTQSGYDRWAQVYDAEDNPLVLLEEQHIGPLLGQVSGLRLLDVGCGTGRHACEWARQGAEVTAVDFSEEMLRRARSKPGADRVKFLAHDLTQPLPLPNATFDRVCSCLVLDHIPVPRTFFAELTRLCRLDGHVLLSVMHPAMSLLGVQARFTDPSSGQKIGPASYTHQIADYLMAALGSGLTLDTISEHIADAELAKCSPRAEKYIGWPLLLLMKFRRSSKL